MAGDDDTVRIEAAGAVLELRSVADAFGGSSRGAQALFEAARVELDVLKDPSAALATVAELRERFGERARRMDNEATLIEVDAYMKQGRLDEAYERSAGLTRDDVPNETRESAMFALGFISFLKHDHTRAVEEFKVMVEADAAGTLVNDALRLMLVIANAQEAGDVEPVNLLADAHADRTRIATAVRFISFPSAYPPHVKRSPRRWNIFASPLTPSKQRLTPSCTSSLSPEAAMRSTGVS